MSWFWEKKILIWNIWAKSELHLNFGNKSFKKQITHEFSTGHTAHPRTTTALLMCSTCCFLPTQCHGFFVLGFRLRRQALVGFKSKVSLTWQSSLSSLQIERPVTSLFTNFCNVRALRLARTINLHSAKFSRCKYFQRQIILLTQLM